MLLLIHYYPCYFVVISPSAWVFTWFSPSPTCFNSSFSQQKLQVLLGRWKGQPRRTGRAQQLRSSRSVKLPARQETSVMKKVVKEAIWALRDFSWFFRVVLQWYHFRIHGWAIQSNFGGGIVGGKTPCQLRGGVVQPFCSEESACIASSSTKWMCIHDRISLLNVGPWFSWNAKFGYIFRVS